MQATLLSIGAVLVVALFGANWRLGTKVGSMSSQLDHLSQDQRDEREDRQRMFARLDQHGERLATLETWRNGEYFRNNATKGATDATT